MFDESEKPSSPLNRLATVLWVSLFRFLQRSMLNAIFFFFFLILFFALQQVVTWLKDGVPRQSSSSTPPTYTLNVDSVQKDDQGMYQCVVTNKLNNDAAHSFAELRLSGK
jgi:hypothetical protein